MPEITYQLHDPTGNFIAESVDFENIREILKDHICEEAWEYEKCVMVDDHYEAIDIGDHIYNASAILAKFGDLDDVFQEVLESDIQYLDRPEIGDYTSYMEYTIRAIIKVTYELVYVTIEQGYPTVTVEQYNDKTEWDTKIVECIKTGWVMSPSKYQYDDISRACVVMI